MERLNMALWQGRSSRKKTGGRYRPFRNKRKHEISTEFQFSVIGDSSIKKYKTMGGNSKDRVMSAEMVNVYDPKKGKTIRTKILTVTENPANPNYVQRNIINKGAIIQTELGEARITSRMGQTGTVNAVLIS